LHNNQQVAYQGSALSVSDQKLVKTAAAQSAHSLSRFLSTSIDVELDPYETRINRYQEISGKGIDAVVNEVPVKLGAAGFMTDRSYLPADAPNRGSRVYVMIGGQSRGYFEIAQQYRGGLPEMAAALKARNLAIHVLSGDHDGERPALQRLFGQDAALRFEASPQEKLDYIRGLQEQGRKVLMIGDGLNDAGALKQADVGMAVSDHSARFTPASDAIIDGGELHKLHRFMDYARSAKTIVTIGFIVSILYNFIGLSFAASASLSPIVAAILMPASSITLVSLATLLGRWFAHRKRIDQ
jgi:Cu+-exporting ATPase